MATMTSLLSTPLEPLLTPLSHFRKSTPSTPLSLSPSPLSISPPCNLSTPSLPSLVLNLSRHPPQPLMLPLCSDNSKSTPLPLSHPMASVSLTRPTTRLLFRSPLPKGEGIKQALAWNREQLLDLRRLWELRRQRRIDRGLIPMAHPPHLISDAALGVENRTSTVTVTLPSSQTPRLTSLPTPLESQCQDPFRPTAWRDLTSVVRRPWRWQLASPPVSGKTTKMLLRFRQSATTAKNSQESSPKASASLPRPLPKGWVYAVEEVGAEVKAEVIDPTQYQITSAPVTHSQLHHAKMLADPHRRLRRASSITEGRRTSHSVSELTPAVKRRRVTSGLTSTLLTPT
jgi:hypothetical protein